MGDLERRYQMADVNDVESALLKVGGSFLIEVVGEEGSMDQRDAVRIQCTEPRSRRPG